MNINNNAAQLKREILIRLAKMLLDGSIFENIDKGSVPHRCCIYHDREILRSRVIARLGFSVEGQEDNGLTLAHYAKEALERKEITWPMLTVLDEACNACVKSHYLVTNACQACLARPCKMNCAKKAIDIVGGRAHIDEGKCVNCGLCMQNCPYHAIIKIPVPCEEACPVGAISKDENGKERIDYHKCIFCGACMRECPFGAMMDKSQLIDVIKAIIDGKKVVAMYAPAIAAQFRATDGQLEGAILKAGFSKVWEVALGADITAAKEAHEFEERMARGDKLMTTSCCPAYVRAVRRHVPELNNCVSDTRSPMHYTAEIARKADPDAITVFIGPCLAKRREGMDDEFVDYVLSAEELGAFFVAKEIDLSQIETTEKTEKPTASGRNYAITGGVANSVKIRLKDPSILKPAIINGLNKEGMKQLKAFGNGTGGDANLVEVMACTGGCIAGPAVITNPKIAAIQLKKYVETGKEDPKEV